MNLKLQKIIFWCFWLTIYARETLEKCDDLLCRNNDCVSGKECDGKVDCKDGSDETTEKCAFSHCTSDTFRCTYGACVNITAKCNGIQDCADNSDETAATCPGIAEKLSLSGNCSRNKFKCLSGECIPINNACNGKKDCMDGSDETGKACASNFCPEFAFRCNYGACVVRDAQCDGIPDCADGSDESVALCGLSHTTRNPLKPHAVQKPTEIEKIPEGSCRLEYVKDLIIAYETSPDKPLQWGQYAENYQPVIYKCPTGYVLEGPEKNWCIQGKWTMDQQPRCAKYCPYSAINGVTIQATCELNGARIDCNPAGLQPGTVASISCQIGYRKPDRVVQETLVCQDEGDWDYYPFRCEQICGTEPTKTKPFILGGERTDISVVPWHVAIYNNKGGDYSYICGGTIINARVIISAAHCFWDEDEHKIADKSRFAVAAGKYYREYNAPERETPQFFNLSILHVPSAYKHRTGYFDHDIAVLVVENHIKFKPYIKPICIQWQSYGTQNLKTDVLGRVAGWGLAEDNKLSDELRVLDMPSLSYDDCYAQAKAEYKDLVTADKFCVAAKFEEAVCSGDSGGGFVVPEKIGGLNVFHLWGLVSNALNIEGKCSGDYLTAFTNIQYYATMIKDFENRHRPK